VPSHKEERATPSAGDDLAVILAAYRFHPAEAVRQEIGEALESWIEDLGPAFSVAQVESMLDEQKGTVIEPFRLEAFDRRLAVLLIRSWSSPTLNTPAIRIVSSDALHSGGGLVVDRSGRSRYEQQYCHGRPHERDMTDCFFAPSLMLPTAGSHEGWKRRAAARIRVDDEGATLALKLDPSLPQSQSDLREMQQSARALERDIALANVGIRVDQWKRGITLRTGSVESLIRFLALCEQQSTVQIDWTAKDRELWSCIVRLESPESETRSLMANLYRTTQGPYPWIDLALPPVDLTPRLRGHIAERIVPHTSWTPILRDLENEAEQSR